MRWISCTVNFANLKAPAKRLFSSICGFITDKCGNRTLPSFRPIITQSSCPSRSLALYLCLNSRGHIPLKLHSNAPEISTPEE
ncbi:unnamed protein product [Pleuronectes platessa]|uniref:Uncharacterized protein n=1 Tax=Pleuronectes platessa TaxID=8262 RepID=A0A9N7YT72_PLEPL|nr:unnamed protein product [Pleuronectes platessa]